MMRKRAVFSDGYVTHPYSGETEEEIRAKVISENQSRIAGPNGKDRDTMQFVLTHESVPNFQRSLSVAQALAQALEEID